MKDVERAISAPVGGKNKNLETGFDCYTKIPPTATGMKIGGLRDLG